MNLGVLAADGRPVIETETPDIVLLDVMLGDDDGLDLLEQVRATRAFRSSC